MYKDLFMQTEQMSKLSSRINDICEWSQDSDVLKSYSENPYLPLIQKKKQPDYIAKPTEVEEIVQLVKIANEYKVPIVPRSSGLDPYGDTIPIFGGLVVDLSKMTKIVKLSATALEGMFVRVEPGVTFAQLQQELKKVDKRVLLPARLSSLTTPASSYYNRNILFSSAKPIYTVDFVILSYEKVLPTGSVLKTGSLTLSQGAGTNPHCRGSDIGRICMGSLGTTGIVTKVTAKIKDRPETRKIFFLCSENFEEILMTNRSLLRYSPIEISEENLTMNKYCLSSLLARDQKEFDNFTSVLPSWIHVMSLNGKTGWVECQEKDLIDAAKTTETSVKPLTELQGAPKATEEFIDEFSLPTRIDRAFKYLPFNRVEFYTTPMKILELHRGVDEVVKKAGYDKPIGCCVIPIEQARSYYVEYDMYFDLSSDQDKECVRNAYRAAYSYLISNGALINTPHDYFVAEQLYSQAQLYYETMLKIKKMLDPNDIFHPGKLFV